MKPGIFAIFGDLKDLVWITADSKIAHNGAAVTYRPDSDTVVCPRTWEANRIADVKPNEKRDSKVVLEEARRNYRKRNQ